MLTLLNTSIITAFGSFDYKPLSLQQAIDFVQTENWQSAIGHASTAEIMSKLLGVDVPVNRIQYAQEAGEQALVFKLKGRPPEGTILSIEEIEAIGNEWGLLTRFD